MLHIYVIEAQKYDFPIQKFSLKRILKCATEKSVTDKNFKTCVFIDSYRFLYRRSDKIGNFERTRGCYIRLPYHQNEKAETVIQANKMH